MSDSLKRFFLQAEDGIRYAATERHCTEPCRAFSDRPRLADCRHDPCHSRGSHAARRWLCRAPTCRNYPGHLRIGPHPPGGNITMIRLSEFAAAIYSDLHEQMS